MKKVVVYSLLAVVIAAGVYLFTGKKSSHPAAPLATTISNNVEQSNQSSPIPSAPTNGPATWVRPPYINETDWKTVVMVGKMMLAANQPIEFHARAMDQNGDPVPGAELDLAVSYVDEKKVLAKYPRIRMGEEVADQSFTNYSDAQGWFRFSGVRGRSLYINNVTRPGFFWQRPADGFGVVQFEPYGKREFGGTIAFDEAFDPRKGYTFHLWKKGMTEPLVPIRIGVDMDREIGGQWVSNYFIRFVPARVEWTNFAGADLIIQGIRRLSGNQSRPYEFIFTLSVPNGGLQVSEDAYTYLAPQNGYQMSWSFENKPQNNPPDFPWTKTCYFQLRNGKMYAGVRLGFCNGGFDFFFDGYLNPSGSRNLEPDPEKLITDPAEIRRIDEQTRSH
jgi:hypothetical protein